MLSLVLAAGWTLVYLGRPFLLDTFELRLTDWLAAAPAADGPSRAVVVVDIDEASLAARGQWPWPRYRLARLLEAVAQGGARSIALDVVLAEPDRTSLAAVRDAMAREFGLEIDLPTDQRAVQDNDRVLAQALSRGPFVVAQHLLFDGPAGRDPACALPPLPAVLRLPAGGAPLRLADAAGAICTLPVLAAAAGTSGFVNGHVDADGRLRRLPLIVRYSGGLLPSLSLAAVMRAEGARAVRLDAAAGAQPHLIVGDTSIPLDLEGRLRIRFREGEPGVPRVSADDVLAGRVSGEPFRGRIVFVGVSATGVAPTYRTPAGAARPAAEIHAQLAETILARDWVRRPDALVGAELATALALALVAGFAVTNLPATVILLGCGLALAALWGGSMALVRGAGLLASPVLPAGVVVINGGALLAVAAWMRQRDARRRTSDALVLMRRSEQELSSILETIPDIVFRLDAAGRITFISPAVSKYRVAPERLIGRPILDLVAPDDRPAATYRVNERRRMPRATRDLEVRLLLPGGAGDDGGPRYFSVSAEGIYTGTGPGPASFAGTQGIARDVDERRRLEAQLVRARQMEAMGTLAAGVAHDLNNILGALVGYPELLLLDLPPDSPMRENLESIQRSGQRAAAIVQDMLTIARRGVRTHEVVNLNRVITAYLASPECQKLQELHPRVRCESDLAPALMNTLGSEVHLSKALMNMVTNAAEAMPAGGRICLATANRYLDEDRPGFERVPEGEYVQVSIVDDGVGIAAEHLPRIFEPFYSKKKLGRSGSGLGMAVVWSTVKDHGGYLDVQSREGEGTRFDLYFPVTRREPDGAGKDVVLQDYVGTERVLVVDDVPEQLTIAVRMLGKLGYDVATASSGEQAVAFLRERTVDLVVLDMVMPAGMDGLETFRRIRAIRPAQAVIIASGYSESERVAAAQAEGAGQYVRKPFTLETIGLAVRRAIDRGDA